MDITINVQPFVVSIFIMTKKINTNIIDQYLAENSNSTHTSYVEECMAKHGESPELKGYIQKDWTNYLNSEHPEQKATLSHVLNKVHHTIRSNETQKRQLFSHKILKWYSSAAAVLLIPLLVAGSLFLFNNITLNEVASNDSIITVSCPMGGKMAFSLPDGSKGMLNSGSLLEYQIPFKERNVKVSGEVYFDVFHDKSHPFTVENQNSKVTVLGTSFNLKSYPEEGLTEIVLVEGKVKCIVPGNGNEVTLEPNDRVIVHSNNKVTKTKVDAQNYTAWKDGKLIFRGDSMKEAISKLSRWYNVDITVADKEIEQYSFRGTFIDDTLDEVLKLLKLTSPIDYKILQRHKLNDGSWSQRKVILYKRKI